MGKLLDEFLPVLIHIMSVITKMLIILDEYGLAWPALLTIVAVILVFWFISLKG